MTRQDMKQLAKDKLKGKWGVVIIAILLYGLINAAASSAFGIIELIVMGPMAVGLCAFFLRIFREDKAEIEDTLSGFNNFFNNFIVGLLKYVFIALWSLLFVIPGIVKSYSYAMTFFIQHDHPDMTETDAITASREMMRGHKGELFILDLSFIGWYLLAALTFGLLLFYVVPYHQAVRTIFYENLVGTATSSTSTEAESDEGSASSVEAIEATLDPFGSSDDNGNLQ